jgi:DNA-binding transcriptional LysR family regulator
MIMNCNTLRVFISVAEKKSITKAANELYISQPAVSKAIKNIEDELHVKLFQRDKRNGLIMTDVGEKILLLARQMVDVEHRMYQAASRENNFLGGRVRIASIPITCSTILSKTIAEFQGQYPCVKVELYEGTAREVKRWVEEHVVDFGIGIAPFGDLEYHHLVHDKIVGISNTERLQGINLKEEKGKIVLCKASQEVAIERMHKDHDIRSNDWFIVSNAETVVSMVSQGVGVGVISQYVLTTVPNSLFTCSVVPSIELEIALIVHSFDELTPVAKEFVMLVQTKNQQTIPSSAFNSPDNIHP